MISSKTMHKAIPRAAIFLLSLTLLGAVSSESQQAHEVQKLQNGIEITSAQKTLRILALRDDVLRITLSPTTTLPEDASWAVLSSSRSAHIRVVEPKESESASDMGFDTALLHVSVNRKTLAVTISDLSGKTILSDAEPVEFKDHAWGKGFRMSKAMPEDEHYFGLGDKTGPLDRRGWAYEMWNTDAYRFQEGTDPLYKDIPFFLAMRAGKSYGLFLDNTWRTSFDFGKEDRSEYTISSEGGPLDYYFFYGPKPKAVLQDYAWLTGTAPLPPLWSLGFQQSRYSYETEQQLRAVADRLRSDHIPADALYMDIDFQIKNRPFTVDESKYPNFSAFVEELAKKQFHLVVITDLHIAKAPNQGYAPYDSGTAGDDFVKNPDGSIFVGKVWPGDSEFPEFTSARSRQWWGTLYHNFYSEGVSGFWNDMNEPSVFATATKTMPVDVQDRIDEPGFAKRTATQREIHNVFGMLNSRATYEGLLQLKPDERPFVLTRATYSGGQRYAATWTGDNSSTWNHLRMSTPMLLSLGLSGFPFAGDDIGGYAGSPQMDLLTKWLEVGAFNPIYRDHTEKFTHDQEPWVGGPQQEAIRRKYIEERYRLLPYIYTVAQEASQSGIPMMRPLFLEFPDATEDRHPLDLDAPNEFMLGSDLLIAPAAYPDQPDDYAVTFPPVQWFNYWTGQRVTKPVSNIAATVFSNNGAAVSTGAALGMGALQTRMIHPTLETLPVFVRGGSILPLEPLVQSTQQKPNGPLELRVFPGENCHGELYLDDGTTFQYRSGNFLKMTFSCQVKQDGGLTIDLGRHTGTYPAWWSEIEMKVYGLDKASWKVEANGQSIPAEASNNLLQFKVPDSGNGLSLNIER